MSQNFYKMSKTVCTGLSSLASWTSRCASLSLKRQISKAQPVPKRNILYTAVCVERVPVITSPRNDLEEKFAQLSAQMEFENSYYSDHEMRLQKEEKMSQKKSESEEGIEEGEGQTETALDLEDKWDAEFKKFVVGSRLTQADETDDKKSLERKLDSSLFLLVKQNIEGRDHWVLPQATWEEGETMRQTAERALKTVCGDVKATFLGNAPCSVAKYEPKDPVEERGIKLFFYKAWYREGSVKPDENLATDYVWVTREELSDYCYPGYKQNLKKFL